MGVIKATIGIAECCRLAACVCTNAFFCNSWDANFITVHFAKQLGYALLRTDVTSCWNEHIELFLWILFVGGMYSKDTPLELSYFHLLSKTCLHLDLVTKPWGSIEEILENYIWSEKAFAKRARALFLDVQVHSNFDLKPAGTVPRHTFTSTAFRAKTGSDYVPYHANARLNI